jgi:glycosyltransferase involved in cell wall biosynthesis
MRLGINGWRMAETHTGVGRYLSNIVRCWTPDRVADRFQEINLYTHRPIAGMVESFPASIRQRVLSPPWRMLIWENLRLGPSAADEVLYHPSFSIPLIRRGKSVVVIHEVVHEMYPRLFPFSARLFYRRLYRWSGRHATLVISGTEGARQDVADRLALPLEKIRVVPMAPAEQFRNPPDADMAVAVRAKHLDPETPYFLFVGKLSGRRSLPILLAGFAAFKQQTRMTHKLLLVGLNPHQVDLNRLIAKAGMAGEAIYLGYVSDVELNVLYHGATALVSPAVYEPVSLPVMEAQAAGTPVICTDSTGMRETTGRFALLLPRLDSEELATAMLRLADDPELRRELGELGKAFSARFSWERSAELTLDVLHEAALA